MARAFKRDAQGRFAGSAGGGGRAGSKPRAAAAKAPKAKKPAASAALIAPVPPTGLRFQTGERLRKGLRKASANELAALDNQLFSRGSREALFNEQRRRYQLEKAKPGVGGRLGGARKTIKPDPWQMALRTGKNADARAGGGAKGTIAGVKAISQQKGMARITAAAKRSRKAKIGKRA